MLLLLQQNLRVAAGGYGETRKRRFIYRVGDRLVITTDASSAMAAVPARELQPVDKIANDAKEGNTEPAAQEISLAEIRMVAAQYKQQARLLQMFRQRDWAEMVALYEALRQQQDEDDIEMMLLAL